MINPSLKEVVSYEKYFNSNDELRRQYQKREDAILDKKFRTYAAQKNEKIRNAINGLKKGYSLEIISDITELTIEEIKKIQKQYL